jgi:2-dehydro-3-deoxyphosphogluconate aldolase/(4S)-4-hydroxy-2-oxoglutarate aldolase
MREIMGLTRVIPELTINKLEDAVPLARALTAGGLKVLQVALRTPAALAAITAMRKEIPDAVIGAGALARPVDFAGADRAGAQFGVSAGFTPELAAAARGARFALLPGVMTPSEILIARQAGFNVLQFFPALQAGGVAMLQALRVSFPDVMFCPAGGITRATAPDFLRLPNVPCVSGTWSAPAALIDAADWSSIEALARDAASLPNA